jgi:flagellar motor switch protein FliN
VARGLRPPAGATQQAGEPPLWWEQPFHGGPDLVVWVAAPRAAWEYAGTITLKAAGLETVAEAECRNTWFEILGQSLSAMARSIGSVVGREITCDAGVERGPEPEAAQWASVSMRFPEAEPPPLAIVFGPRLLPALWSPAAQAEPHEEAEPEAAGEEAAPVRSRTMDLLLEVDLPVSISFGKTQLALKDVLKLTTGSIVELNRGVNDQVEVLVNHCLVARGEVVVVEGNYGVRIQEIASRRDRLRSLR